jgi:hypothetical protein
MQLKKMEQDDPAGFMCVNLALELAELHPGHAGAICLDCGPRSKLIAFQELLVPFGEK